MQNHPTFAELCEQYHYDDESLWTLSRLAGVSKRVIEVMRMGTPVERKDAGNVLAALCYQTQSSWTFETTDIPYVGEVPTFQRLCQRHQIDASRLSTQSGVPIAIIDHMRMNQPVPVGDAMKVLQVLSRIAGKDYNLSTVNVKVERAGTP